METNKEKRDEVIRFLRWASKHQVVWRSICSDDALEPGQCLEVMEELVKNGFYLLIPVLIERNKINYATDKALYYFILNKLADDWEEKDIMEIVAELEKALQPI